MPAYVLLAIHVWDILMTRYGLVHGTGVHERNTMRMHKFALQSKAQFWCKSTG